MEHQWRGDHSAPSGAANTMQQIGPMYQCLCLGLILQGFALAVQLDFWVINASISYWVLRAVREKVVPHRATPQFCDTKPTAN
jgi:hypothetical protein